MSMVQLRWNGEAAVQLPDNTILNKGGTASFTQEQADEMLAVYPKGDPREGTSIRPNWESVSAPKKITKK